MGDVVVGEGFGCAVFELFLGGLVAADVGVPGGFRDPAKVLLWVYVDTAEAFFGGR